MFWFESSDWNFLQWHTEELFSSISCHSPRFIPCAANQTRQLRWKQSAALTSENNPACFLTEHRRCSRCSDSVEPWPRASASGANLCAAHVTMKSAVASDWSTQAAALTGPCCIFLFCLAFFASVTNLRRVKPHVGMGTSTRASLSWSQQLQWRLVQKHSLFVSYWLLFHIDVQVFP